MTNGLTGFGYDDTVIVSIDSTAIYDLWFIPRVPYES